MTGHSDSQPWKGRQEIPEPQIRDAADQYEAAHRLLDAQPPGSGVLLPLINTAAVAIELYLKFSARKVFSPLGDAEDAYRVTADPALKGRAGHDLSALLEEAPEDVRQNVEAAFTTETSCDLRWALSRCNGAFAISRFPFEKDADVSKVDLAGLRQVVRFLHDFIAKYPPVERIDWT